MSSKGNSPHLYLRAVREGNTQDSLSVIASLIGPGQTLLDLGMGAGGLGQHLSQKRNLVADGVSLNPAEARIAQTWYRTSLVADLDHDQLETLFGTQQYDCIVCADVLEHLKAPELILEQCKSLLRPGGRLIISVPNAAYCGLVAELMQGDLKYRPEGLLDRTHLRFFTRTSLQRFATDAGWRTHSVQTIERSLTESEFQVAFDSLPPAVARYLLALPDALVYQYVCVLEPNDKSTDSTPPQAFGDTGTTEKAPSAAALFTSMLYLAVDGQFSETSKLVTTGRIGDAMQTLVFDIPASRQIYSRIRLDPADRPGFFRLHHLHLRLPDGQLLLQWLAEPADLATLAHARMHQILLSPPNATSTGALLLLLGEDPWIELPFEAEWLSQISKAGAKLEVGVGWPMSADFLQASVTVGALEVQHQHSLLLLKEEVASLEHQLAQTETRRRAQQIQIDTLIETAQTSVTEKQQLLHELTTSASERESLRQQFQQVDLQLKDIERSTVFRATRPLVRMKMALDRMLGRTTRNKAALQTNNHAAALPALPTSPVDIIVPVYRGLEDTRCCIASVLNANCQTAWRLLVINDHSPEPDLSHWLRDLASREPRITLLENSENLGFVATVNRGMAMSPDRDVLLLNSDAEVANDWLDRIQRTAYSGPRVASVTPFSNNATICSYPRFCQSNEIPDSFSTTHLDRLFAQHLAGQSVEIPTGVGFCMYIRRQCLQETGLFDVANFGKGYGEENDFCVRAQKLGWTHLHALDTFVRHAGGVSFGDAKNTRELEAMQTLRRLHPDYENQIHAFLERDPARNARWTIDVARTVARRLPVILNVVHDREGGTLRHIEELAQQFGKQASFLTLSPTSGGATLQLVGSQEAYFQKFDLPQGQTDLLQTLRQLQVGHIHFHHLLGHSSSIADLPEQLGVSHDFTAHDFYSYCPQISLTDANDGYCGELGLEQCQQCLQRRPAPGDESIKSWRKRHAVFLNRARYVLAPSVDTARRMQGFVPKANIRVAPHWSVSDIAPTSYPAPTPRQLSNQQALKIVVLGALSKIKGADVLEQVATLAAEQDLPLEFHLAGFAYRNLRTQPRAKLSVHGSYQQRDLPQLLNWLQPDLVWFPALWPETYSYTLSASLENGLPIAAPDIGAFPERLLSRDWTWLCDWQLSASQWLEFFTHIRQQHFCETNAIAPRAETHQPLTFSFPAFSYRSDYLQDVPLPGAVSPASIAMTPS